jgi:hypothetical protein
MRTVMAAGAAIWFLGAAIVIGDGSSALLGDPPNQEVIGDPVVMAIHLVARILFVGCGLLALGLVDWAAIRRLFRD